MATLNRESAGVELPIEFRADLVKQVKQVSAFTQIARVIDQTDDTITPTFGGLNSARLRREGTLKPAGTHTVGSKLQRLQYISTEVVSYSKQMLLSKNRTAFYEALIQDHRNALARGLDETILAETAFEGFDSLALSPSVPVAKATLVDDLQAARLSVAKTNRRINGYVLTGVGEITLTGATDTLGRPIYNNSDTASTTLNGSRVVYTDGDFGDVLGVAGNFEDMVIGVHPDDVQIVVFNEAMEDADGNIRTLKQHNEFAVMLEIAVSVGIGNKDSFVKLTEPDEGV